MKSINLPYIPIIYEFGRLLIHEWFFNVFALLTTALALFISYSRAKNPINYGRLYHEPLDKHKLWFLIPAALSIFLVNMISLAAFVYFTLLFSKQTTGMDPINVPSLMIIAYRLWRGLIYPFFRFNSRRWPVTVFLYFLGTNILMSILQSRTLMMEYWGFGGILLYVLTGIWILAFLMNIRYDVYLGTRKNKKKHGYSVLVLGLFKKVTAANYTCELIMVVSWCLFCSISIGSLAVLVWVLPNLVIRARQLHHWEKVHFTNTKLNKTPIIPWWTFKPKKGDFYGIFDFLIY